VSPQRSAEVIVVGLGAMGSAACFQLASRGASVIGIDRFAPPHAFGSTHGDTRITRLAIGEGPEYVPLVRRSHVLWRQIERESGAELLTQCGGLVLGDAGNPFLEQTRAAARQYSIAYEDLGSEQLAERFPAFAIDGRVEAYHEPEAGYVRPEAAVRAQLELAERHGAVLRTGERVTSWTATGGGVTVETDRATYAAGQLVLSPGPWIHELFPEAADDFAIHRQLLYWFPVRKHFEQFAAMPVFVWDFGAVAEDFVHFNGIYGFPAVDGPTGGVKLATETYEYTTTPDGRQHPATGPEIRRMYRHYVGPQLPWLGSTPLRTVSCLYTSTRANRFVIDRHPEHERVLIVSPCSGHGFKHSAAIGESIAQWAIDGRAELDLSVFTLACARVRTGD
jgi:sarcosine oxidase